MRAGGEVGAQQDPEDTAILLGPVRELRVDGGTGCLRILRVDETEEEAGEFVVREFDIRHGADGMGTFEQRFDEGFGGHAAVDFEEVALLELEGVV